MANNDDDERFDFCMWSPDEEGGFCAMCGCEAKDIPLLDFLLPPMSAAMQLCRECIERIARAAERLLPRYWSH